MIIYSRAYGTLYSVEGENLIKNYLRLRFLVQYFEFLDTSNIFAWLQCQKFISVNWLKTINKT